MRDALKKGMRYKQDVWTSQREYGIQSSILREGTIMIPSKRMCTLAFLLRVYWRIIKKSGHNWQTDSRQSPCKLHSTEWWALSCWMMKSWWSCVYMANFYQNDFYKLGQMVLFTWKIWSVLQIRYIGYGILAEGMLLSAYHHPDYQISKAWEVPQDYQSKRSKANCHRIRKRWQCTPPLQCAN